MKLKLTKRQREARLRAQAKGYKLPRAVNVPAIRECCRSLHCQVFEATRRTVTV